jgi:magnesium-protoporphyrin O-methyltransferase
VASCCSFADSAKNHFGKKDAEKTLARYLNKGPDETTRLPGERLASEGLVSGTVLDIGAGLGLLSLELLKLGADRSTAVDASEAFIETGRNEAKRQGRDERMSFLQADFVQVADSMPPATLVVMDRAVCC